MMVHIPPAQLWIGTGMHEALIHYLQNIWCHCGVCDVCKTIAEKTFARIVWVKPQLTKYSVDDIDTKIHRHTNLMADEESPIFFIIEHAERLTVQAATRLLKVVEEPPKGYHFIFLSNQEHVVLSTLRSRCLIRHYGMLSNNMSWQGVMNLLCASHDKILILQEIEKLGLSEHEIPLFVELLLQRFQSLTFQALQEKNENKYRHFKCRSDSLAQLFQLLPVAGNLKFFWRQLIMVL